jgi:cystathionine beta-lyase/cystathionine gamma-synthase
MTHISLLPELKSNLGITDGLIRLSVGLEYFEDLISDISNSLDII